MRLQQTLKQEVIFSGVGLHTGRQATVKLKPAPRDTGIVFYRIDKGAGIRANVTAVIDTAFATTLGVNGTRVRTVEHLLAAAAGLSIDNMIVEMDGPEVPILDGSSSNLVGIILETGIAKQGKRIPVLKIKRPILYEDAHARIAAFPYDGKRITYYIYFGHSLLKEQQLTIDISEDSFIKEIAPARTFGFLRDVERLRANGLAKGGSLDNAVIVGENGVLNASGLRFHDEFVRHKILDAMGDLSLIGLPIEGHIIFEKSGHTANVNFLKKLIVSVDCYELISEIDSVSHHALAYN